MNLNIFKETTYYILSPSNFSSGGPKHMHQLGVELRNLGKNVFMYYYKHTVKTKLQKKQKYFVVVIKLSI